jgi:Hg(II)-responsive transcriptional regulator
MIGRMRTGELAAHAGVNVQTVRFYERRGIVPKPARTANGYRVYSVEAVRLIRFIKRAQELGFTLDEVQELLRLRNNRRSSCAAVKSAGRIKMVAVEAKIANLKAIKRALAVLLASCDRNDRDRACPILEALEAADERPSRSPS